VLPHRRVTPHLTQRRILANPGLYCRIGQQRAHQGSEAGGSVGRRRAVLPVVRTRGGLMRCMMLWHLARPGGVPGVTQRGRVLPCRVLGVPLPGRCRRSVPGVRRVGLLGGSRACSSAVSCMGLCCARGAVLHVSGMIGPTGYSAGGWRVPRMGAVIMLARGASRCCGSAVARMALGGRGMACVPLVTGGGSAMVCVSRSRRTARRGRTVSCVRIAP
jgi:hypothetical protein